jgi:ubiquinone/menaquinone biosynthesis C-methylase UbiE
MQGVVERHYRRLAKDYDSFLYYSPDFVRALTAKMREKLQLQPPDRMVDLGCGTGIYSLDLLAQVALQHPVIGVDPFPEMLARIPEDAPIERVCEDALTFSTRPGTYDKVLIKETIHHVDRKEELLANLHARLPVHGVLLLVHVPPRIRYPLFQAALDRCLQWHADPDDLVDLLQRAGFAVERDALEYEHVIPRDHYLKMVQSRYMSVLTSFSDEELEAGLAEMNARYVRHPELRFIDRFDYLTATRQG